MKRKKLVSMLLITAMTATAEITERPQMQDLLLREQKVLQMQEQKMVM